MKYLITGGRDYQHRGNVWKALTHLVEPDDFLIVGDADGVDRFAREWAKRFKRKHRVVRAPWYALGKGAGHLRNSYMLDLHPEFVIAFPGNEGTENCKKQAREARGLDTVSTRRKEMTARCKPSAVAHYQAKMIPMCQGGVGCPSCWHKYIEINGPLTDEQAYRYSTKEERVAIDQYRGLQEEAASNYNLVGETWYLMMSQCLPLIVERNKRFGLCQ